MSSTFKLVCLSIVNVQIMFELICLLFKYYLSTFQMHDIYIAFTSFALRFADTCTHSVSTFVLGNDPPPPSPLTTYDSCCVFLSNLLQA